MENSNYVHVWTFEHYLSLRNGLTELGTTIFKRQKIHQAQK